MKLEVTTKAKELLPGAGVQEIDEVQSIEIDLVTAGGFTITSEDDGIWILAHGGLVIVPLASNVLRLQARDRNVLVGR